MPVFPHPCPSQSQFSPAHLPQERAVMATLSLVSITPHHTPSLLCPALCSRD